MIPGYRTGRFPGTSRRKQSAEAGSSSVRYRENGFTTETQSMKRNWVLGTLCGAALVAAAAFVVFGNRSVAEGQPTKPQNGGEVREATNLPITQVVLFSSGVGYFQREGKVEGNARIDLTFPVQDINDL